MLTLARAKESSPFDPGVSQRNLSSGTVSVPFGGKNDTRVLSNRIESQHNFELMKFATLTLGYQFREQQGKNDTGLSRKIIFVTCWICTGAGETSEAIICDSGFPL